MVEIYSGWKKDLLEKSFMIRRTNITLFGHNDKRGVWINLRLSYLRTLSSMVVVASCSRAVLLPLVPVHYESGWRNEKGLSPNSLISLEVDS